MTDELDAACALLEAMFDEPPAVWSGTTVDRADYTNGRWLTYAGTAAPDWQASVHADDLETCTQALGATLGDGSALAVEARLRRADGEYRWHRVRFAIAVLKDGPRRWLATITQAGSRHDDRAKDVFLALVSHELRAPITTILLWERVLRDGSLDPALRVRALDAIHDSAMTQSRLVGDLLDISRAAVGKLHVDLRPVAIARILGTAVDSAEVLASQKKQRVERHYDPDLAQVSGDSNRLLQIFENLLTNAVKFTGAGGTIRVSARRMNASVVIEIADTGCGISGDLLPRIFEPFVQDDEVRSGGGLGLGLAIARELVTAHHGTLEARSDGRGRGSTFTITMPASAQLETPRSRSPATRLGGLRVLVVDDDPRVLVAMQAVLEGAGAVVEAEGSAAGGFCALERTLPDLVLSDISMPGEDGYSFVRRIRDAGGSLAGVPTIALTAHVTEADRQRALAAGFDLYLTKPVQIDHLISTIVRLVETKHAQK